MTRPADHPWRSPVADRLVAAGGTFRAYGDSALCESVPGGTSARARDLALADLSPLPRLGIKGRDTRAWVAGRGLAVPAANNRWVDGGDGTRVARLGDGELLLLGALAGDDRVLWRLAGALEKANGAKDGATSDGAACYPVPRRDSHAWFRLTGARTPAFLARLCAVDLRPAAFPADGVAQTMVATLSAVLIRDDIAGLPAYHLLTDTAGAGWLWDVLADVLADMNGALVGREALSRLAG